MPRAFHLHTVLFLLAAFTFLFFTALSLPFVPSLDLVRVHWEGVPSTGYGGQASLTELRLGTWGYCWYESTGLRYCTPASHAYMLTLYNPDKSRFQFLAAPFTRGLAVHPTAGGLTLLTLLLSLLPLSPLSPSSSHSSTFSNSTFSNSTFSNSTFSNSTFLTILKLLIALLASLFAIACLVVDFVLYRGVKSRVERLEGSVGDVRLGSGFYLTAASLLLLILAGLTLSFGRRRDRLLSSTLSSSLSGAGAVGGLLGGGSGAGSYAMLPSGQERDRRGSGGHGKKPSIRARFPL